MFAHLGVLLYIILTPFPEKNSQQFLIVIFPLFFLLFF